MSERRFRPWVQPCAEMLASARAEVIAFSRSQPAEFWQRASGIDPWTNHDLLAHLAGGNDQLLQTLLRAVTSRTPIAPALLRPDTDAENGARIEERRTWSLPDLIAELERDRDETQELLSRLTDVHRDLKPDGLGLTVAQFLRIVEHERHDMEHLAQLRAGA